MLSWEMPSENYCAGAVCLLCDIHLPFRLVVDLGLVLPCVLSTLLTRKESKTLKDLMKDKILVGMDPHCLTRGLSELLH